MLDREIKDKDVFIVRVCDSGRDILLCIRFWIIVNILDVNEVFSFKYNKEVFVFCILENFNCFLILDLIEFFLDGDFGVNREFDFSVLRLVFDYKKWEFMFIVLKVLVIIVLFLILCKNF